MPDEILGQQPAVTETPVTTEPANPAAGQEPVTPQVPAAAPTDPTGTVPEKDYKELLSEFTRRSQELASLKKAGQPEQPKQSVELPWQKDPNWDAKNYDELTTPLIAKAKEEIWKSIIDESEREEREAAEQQRFVESEIEQLKSMDKDVKVNDVLAHAQKYSFTSLIPAYQNMRAIEDAERRTEERIVKNFKLRSSEPVGSPNAVPTENMQFPPDVRTGYEKARYALRNSK